MASWQNLQPEVDPERGIGVRLIYPPCHTAGAGVLVTGGRPLEDLGRLISIALDKTGTLTEGRPKLVDVIPREGVAELELLSVAVAVEHLSDPSLC